MKKTNKYRLIAFLVLASSAVIAGSTTTEQKATSAVAAFEQLTSLAGDWEGAQDGFPTPIQETYAVVAKGSALMVETKANGSSSPMITMYTLDGDRIIAVHYCNARNQPEMVSSEPGDLNKGLTFFFERVTGMKTAGDWHNTGLEIKLDDKDHMTQRWTYLENGKAGTNVFHYTRVTKQVKEQR